MSNPINSEPVLTAAVITPIVVWLAARFALDVDYETATAIATAVLAVGGIIARLHVTPTQKAEKAIEEALVAQPGVDPKPTL